MYLTLCRLAQKNAPPLTDNRLRILGDCRWDYDAHGNVTEKRAGHHTVQRFRWNAEHQLEAAVTRRNGTEQRIRYGYDAFGRRSWKQDASGVTHFIWDGNRLLNGQPQGKAVTTRFVWNGFLACFLYDLHCLTHPLTAACFHQRGNATRPLRTGAASWR
ncbi:hypothetical protein M1E08_17375 [Erwinia sp. PK3-005]